MISRNNNTYSIPQFYDVCFVSFVSGIHCWLSKMQICSPMLVPWLISLTGFASLWNTVKSAESNNFRKQATFMDNHLDFSDLVIPFDTVRNTVEFHHDIVNKSPNHLTLLWKRKQFISNNLVVERAKAFLFDPKKNRFLSPKVIIRDGQGSVRHNSFPNFSRRKKSRSMFSLRTDHFKTQRKRKYMGDDSSSEDLYPGNYCHGNNKFRRTESFNL